jgi:RNA polymerase sigma-70 factor, ECF subfamily
MQANDEPFPAFDSVGESRARELLAETYAELRRLAASYLRGERPDHTLQPTALVHEAWCRLAGRAAALGESRERFIATASMVMRRILVDHARTKGAAKRGGERHRVTLAPELAVAESTCDVIALDDALNRLRSIDERQARLVELRFFGGLSLAEAAALTNLPARSADREWACAKAWLWEALREDTARPSDD